MHAAAEGCEWLKRLRRGRFSVPGSPVERYSKCNGLPGALFTAQQLQPIESSASWFVQRADYKKVVIIRDPADRFVSAVADKCVRSYMRDIRKGMKEVAVHCPMPRGFKEKLPNGFNPNKLDAWVPRVIEELERLSLLRGPLWYQSIDAHFKPQAAYALHTLPLVDCLCHFPRQYPVGCLMVLVSRPDTVGLARACHSPTSC